MKLLAASFCALISLGTARLAAQAVQLPSYEFFGTSTTVSVPDRGAVSLGGVNSAASGSNQFGGLPGNRSRGMAGQASGVSVTAHIHDFDAMDQALLAEAARRRQGAALAQPGRRFEPSTGGNAGSVAELESRRRSERPDPQREAENYFARARQAEETGKPRLARVYYQMAARRASGDLKERALAQIEAIGQIVGSGEKPHVR